MTMKWAILFTDNDGIHLRGLYESEEHAAQSAPDHWEPGCWTPVPIDVGTDPRLSSPGASALISFDTNRDAYELLKRAADGQGCSVGHFAFLAAMAEAQRLLGK